MSCTLSSSYWEKKVNTHRYDNKTNKQTNKQTPAHTYIKTRRQIDGFVFSEKCTTHPSWLKTLHAAKWNFPFAQTLCHKEHERTLPTNEQLSQQPNKQTLSRPHSLTKVVQLSHKCEWKIRFVRHFEGFSSRSPQFPQHRPLSALTAARLFRLAFVCMNQKKTKNKKQKTKRNSQCK